MSKRDQFAAWLGSDTDLPFAEWRQLRRRRGLSQADLLRAIVVCLVALSVLLWAAYGGGE